MHARALSGASKNALLVLAALGMLPGANSAAHAQSVPYLEDSSIYGTASVITVSRVPIKTADGIVYKDLTLTLASVDSNGTLKGTAKVTQVVSPMLPTGGLMAGVYGRSDNTGIQLQLSGPGALGNTGEAVWTMVTLHYDPCGAPATVYAGKLQQNPLYARLQAAGIKDTTYSYGVINSGAACGNPWDADYLIGVQQVGNQIIVSSFTSAGQDQSTPVARYTYNLIPPQ